MNSVRTLRLAAIGDVHFTKAPAEPPQSLFAQAADVADVLLLCGDLTDNGLPEEAEVFVRELKGVKMPIIAVLGNHDYESDQQDEVRKILTDAGVNVLDGDSCEVNGVGFGGTKGFGGGFGPRTLAPWGERAIKQFVQEAV